MKNIIKKILYLFILPAIAFSGCEEPDYGTPEPATGATTARSNLMVVNAAPGSAALTGLLIDNMPVSGTLPSFTETYPINTAAEKYLQIPAGNRQVRAKIEGVSADAVATSSFNTGRYYSFFVTDTTSRPIDRDRYVVRPLIVSDNLSAPAAGKAKVRFLHLAPNAPSVGVYNTVTNAVLFPNRAYRATSTGSGSSRVDFTNFIEVDAGTYTLDVRTTATAMPVLVLPALAFEAGKIYTVYARGLAMNNTTPLGVSIIVHN